jgi:diguanylate cyclase (GGDEF)-like protein
MLNFSNKGLVAILFLCIAASAYLLFSSYREVGDTYAQAKLIIVQQQTKHRLVTNMYKAARERSIILLMMHATEDLFELDEHDQQLGVQAEKFINARLQLMDMDLSKEERIILKEQSELVNTNSPLQNQTAALLIQGDHEVAEKLLFERAIPGQRLILNKIEEIRAFYEKNAKKVIADIDSSYANASGDFQKLSAALLVIISLILLYAIRASRHEKKRLIRSAEKMSYQATHDPLTGLINRWEFETSLGHLLDNVDVGAPHCVLYLDLDQFKIVNDTCGHRAGDELLKQIAILMRSCIREQDILARIGGDEFGIILSSCNTKNAGKLANAIIQAMTEYRFHWEKYKFRVGVSIGIIQVVRENSNLGDILKHIDAACYAAKEGGGNRFHVYTESDLSLLHRKSEMDWVIQIENAFEFNMFVLFAQPIVSTKDDTSAINYELLIRMKTEHNELILAGIFLPAAERYNKMVDIDRWVVNEALSILSDQPGFVDQVGYISINLSSQSLTDTKFLDFIVEQFTRHKNLAEKICFEITETVAIANMLQANRCISVLRDMGIRFSLDDFGSGLASFEYLKTLPIDYLKIDGMFVKDIVSDPIDRAMVKSIHEIGSVMGIITIAEFVENNEILDELKTIGVDYAQGYLMGHPMPFKKIITGDFENH